MELFAIFVRLLGPTLARILFAYVLKDRVTLESIQSSEIAETLADSLDIRSAVERLTDGNWTASRNAPYVFETIGEEVARQLAAVFEHERQGMSDGELEQVVEAATETMERWSLPLLIETGFDPIRFGRKLRQKPPKFPAWSQVQTEFYERLLETSSQLVYAVADRIPNFTRDTTAQLLQNENELLSQMRKALADQERIYNETYGRQRATENEQFETSYRTQLASALDRLSLFGVPLLQGARQPLTVAFVKMRTVLDERKEQVSHQPNDRGSESGELVDVEQVFNSHRRLVVIARAGYGKTTLLKWAAVQIARNLPDAKVQTWYGRVPFFIQLRDYVHDPLPKISDLPLGLKAKEVQILAGSVPDNWAFKRLQDEQGVIFLDGLDEVNDKKREEALQWIENILRVAPGTIVILSGRPSAIDNEQVQPELSRQGFQFVSLQPMDEEMIVGFVRQWHEAIAHAHSKYPDKERVPDRQEKILEVLLQRSELMSLASTPLICAMLCALNLTELGELPRDRIQLYNRCINLLLERDEARKVDLSDYNVNLRAANARRLLARIAFWMMECGQASVQREDAERLIAREGLDGQKIATYLAERSGILQKQSEETFEFLHRTFQEFLAAQQIVDDHRVRIMVQQYGRNDTWREAICLLAGFVKPRDQQELLEVLLESAQQGQEDKERYHYLAWSFWELLDESTEAADELMKKHAAAMTTNGGIVLNLWGPEVADVRPLTGLTDLQFLNLFGAQVADVSPLAGLSNLQSLYLGGTQVADVSPLARLSNLQSLNLSRTQVADVSPLARLSNLQSMALSGTQVADVSPLVGLRNLQSLDLSGTQVADVSPLAGLSNLRSLYLGGTPVADVSPLAVLSNLQSLFLSHMQVADVSPLAGLSNLQSLALIGTQVADVNPLAGLRNLQSLNLSGTQVADVSPLAGLSNLQSLDLSHTQVADVSLLADLISENSLLIELSAQQIIQFLPGLSKILRLNLRVRDLEDIDILNELANLQVLSLHHPQIEDVSPLAGLSNLQSLDLSRTQVADVSPLAGLSNLQSLDLSDTQVVDVSPLTGLSNLQSLNLFHTQVADVSPLAGLSNLQSLDLSHTQVADVSLLAGLRNLQSLYLGGTPVADVSPLAGLSNLQSLYLGGTPVADVGPLAGLSNLQSLYLGGTQVADVSSLAGLMNLQWLYLGGSKVTDVSPLKHLEKLEVRFS